jgi:hypothetical protein
MRFGIFSDLRRVHLFLSGHFKRMLRGCGRVFGGEVPGKQFVDPVTGINAVAVSPAPNSKPLR